MSGAIFICGAHCAGKTTTLKMLAQEGVLDGQEPELGKELFYKRRFKTEKAGAEFELELTRLELERDAELCKLDGLIGIETWHVGNLAYVAVRNPSMQTQLVELMKTSPLLDDIRGIWLRVSRENIFARTQTFKENREWAADFYTKIESSMEECIRRLGLEDRVVSIDANREFDRVVDDVKREIKKFDLGR